MLNLLLLHFALLFQPAANYAELVLNSCLSNYRCNTKPASSVGLDYVSGLVMKATVEAVQAQPDNQGAENWYREVRDYGNAYWSAVPEQPKDLDILNACKLYFGLRDVAVSGRFGSDTKTVAACDSALGRAARALAYYDRTYRISDSVSLAYDGSLFYSGGWWHKGKYVNEMWCDGQYMGPALLAQLLARGYVPEGRTADEWWQLLVHQFDITWYQLWNPYDRLLYHAFSASPESDAAWADLDSAAWHYGTSSEYWSRAVGWYMLALVDVLEAMEQTGVSTRHGLTLARERLTFYLRRLAAGVAARQDAASGCWTQLLQYPVGYQPEGCDKSNYLEASGSALFTACYLKALRLHLLPDGVYRPLAERAFRGLVEQFLTDEVGDGNRLALVHSCASAGLSDTRKGDAAYYLCGKDVTQINDYTEGKILGAFVMAATEYFLSATEYTNAHH
ncbi:MAG: glycoside hydrolase family 88 protein [Paludibacteraceae bacterium]|nr:glycoside hydrolase family 88 protein [Paludibacteraceae bacterium]